MLSQSIIPELKDEFGRTRKMLQRIPFDQFGWKPHDKSMTLGRLSTHVAELAGWIPTIVKQPNLDLMTMKREPSQAQSTEDIVAVMDKKLAEAIEALSTATDEDLMTPWSLTRGEHVVFTLPRIAVIRTMSLNHVIHHRGQLSVYLRLLNVAVPGMYGPSADEQ